MVGLDGDAGSNRLDVPPAELIADAEAVVRGGVHGVESAMDAILGVLVAGGVIILSENTRFPRDGGKAIGKAVGGAPGGDVVVAVGTTFANAFDGVVEIAECQALPANAISLLAFVAGFGFGLRGGFERDTGIHPPQDEWFEPRSRQNEIIDAAIHPVNVVSLLVVADALVHWNHDRGGEDPQVDAI